MSLEKYRYTIYPDRTYVLTVDDVTIELKGEDILNMLGYLFE
jgi:hypothetical protein